MKVVCSGWMDEGERRTRDPRFDKAARFTYAIVQSTRDAYIEEETILVSGVSVIIYKKTPRQYTTRLSRSCRQVRK